MVDPIPREERIATAIFDLFDIADETVPNYGDMIARIKYLPFGEREELSDMAALRDLLIDATGEAQSEYEYKYPGSEVTPYTFLSLLTCGATFGVAIGWSIATFM